MHESRRKYCACCTLAPWVDVSSPNPPPFPTSGATDHAHSNSVPWFPSTSVPWFPLTSVLSLPFLSSLLTFPHRRRNDRPFKGGHTICALWCVRAGHMTGLSQQDISAAEADHCVHSYISAAETDHCVPSYIPVMCDSVQAAHV